MADQKAILKAGDKEIELPILSGTEGQDVIDVRSLGANGYFTFDPGFMATGSCESSITYIDGAKGVLLHRGYPIEELARDASYLEVCYMLLNGEAPDTEQYEDFSATITRHTMVHEQINMFFHGFRNDAHPMAMLCGTVGAMSSFYHSDLDVSNPEERMRSAHRLIAKMPTLVAMCYKYNVGQPFVYPRNDLSYAGRNTKSAQRLNAQWTAFSHCTQTTSKTLLRLLYVWLVLLVPILMHVLLLVLHHCGDLLTAVQTKRV